MASAYPGGLDSFATDKADATTTPTDHPGHHNDLADAVNKIEAELGVDPAGSEATVVARLNAQFPDGVANVDWDPTLEGITSNPGVSAVDGAKYRIGALMFCWARWVLTSAGSGTFFVTLPATAVGIPADTGDGTAIGSWQARDNNGPANSLSGAVILSTTVRARFRLPSGGLSLDSSTITWATGDVVAFQATYPIA